METVTGLTGALWCYPVRLRVLRLWAKLPSDAAHYVLYTAAAHVALSLWLVKAELDLNE